MAVRLRHSGECKVLNAKCKMIIPDPILHFAIRTQYFAPKLPLVFGEIRMSRVCSYPYPGVRPAVDFGV